MTLANRIDLVRPDAPELAPTGRFGVGVRTIAAINRDQIDVPRATDKTAPRSDRHLTLEVWYPARTSGRGGTYLTLLRDGHTEVTLVGRAGRDAQPDRASAPYPVIVISHGYPGNRHLLSHFGENLASKGYVCVAIDHSDSLYQDRTDFASTLVNRPLDQAFALDEIGRLSASDHSFLSGLADTSRAGLIGYSMGGYGAIVSAGGGLTASAANDAEACPGNILAMHQAGSEAHCKLTDPPRFSAAIAIAPWGMERQIWDAHGLAGIRIPLMLIAGDRDEVSGYDNGVKAIHERSSGDRRYLLTFHGAGHNVAAPIPAPVEAWAPSPHLDFPPFDHYADPVWDTVRMNNIAQHIATAFFGRFVNDQNQMARYLDLPREAAETWPGFAEDTARGLSMCLGTA